MQYIDDIILWGKRAEEIFEKREKVIHVLLKDSFAVRRGKVKGLHNKSRFQELN